MAVKSLIVLLENVVFKKGDQEFIGWLLLVFKLSIEYSKGVQLQARFLNSNKTMRLSPDTISRQS